MPDLRSNYRLGTRSTLATNSTPTHSTLTTQVKYLYRMLFIGIIRRHPIRILVFVALSISWFGFKLYKILKTRILRNLALSRSYEITDSIRNACESIDAMKLMYKQKIAPLESASNFEKFHGSSLIDADFDAPPMVLLMGQYSTGKTTLINYLLGENMQYPEAEVGDGPSTTTFTAVMHGNDSRTFPGNFFSTAVNSPFHGLNAFGQGFLNHFIGSQCNAAILQEMVFIDTPGVLGGEQDSRSYKYSDVIAWFAERVDCILLMFSHNQMDISDELKLAIKHVLNHNANVRIVLNRADMPAEDLLRVYGGLLFALGKVIKTPEVPKVHVVSAIHGQVRNPEVSGLLEADQGKLLNHLLSLKSKSRSRRLDELIKRAKKLRVHMHIVNHLRNQLRWRNWLGWIFSSNVQSEILKNLSDHFKAVQQKTNLPESDFPDLSLFHQHIMSCDLLAFGFAEHSLEILDHVINCDVPNLKRLIEIELNRSTHANVPNNPVGNNDEDALIQWQLI